jgi:AraC-like DNA-binding protein
MLSNSRVTDAPSFQSPHLLRFSTDDLPEKDRLPNAEDRLARRIAPDTPAVGLLKIYAEAWQQGELADTPHMQQVFANHMRDLFALACAAAGDAAQMAVRGGARAARMMAIQREIDRSFGNPDFSLPALAQRIGVTPRYVQILLEEANSSFVKEVTDRRLKRAEELLQSPRHRHLSVIDIAYECGFSTMAHFHRLFRRRYGTTPGNKRCSGALSTEGILQN